MGVRHYHLHVSYVKLDNLKCGNFVIYDGKQNIQNIWAQLFKSLLA